LLRVLSLLNAIMAKSQDESSQGDFPEIDAQIAELTRQLQRASRSGVVAASTAAEDLVRRGVVVPLLRRLQQSSEATAAQDLLDVMHGIALERLREAGWRPVGRGEHSGALCFRHTDGREEEEPRLPGQSWEAFLLQSVAVLSASGILAGARCWCCEVVEHHTCCGGKLLLSQECNHAAMRTIVDVVVEADDGDDGEVSVGRQRQLHAGVWQGPDAGARSGCNLSLSPGTTLEPWDEVTIVGLTLLLTASVDAPRVLVLGVGSGVVLSFLGRHAPHLRVEALEPQEERTRLAQRRFGLQVEGSDLHAQCDVGVSKRRKQRPVAGRPCTVLRGAASNKYEVILALGPPARDEDGCDGLDLPGLKAMLQPGGALLVQARSTRRSLATDVPLLRAHFGEHVVCLAELDLREEMDEDLADPAEADDDPCVLLASQTAVELTADAWHRRLQAPLGAFRSGAMDIGAAQRTGVVCVEGFLDGATLRSSLALEDSAQRAKVGTEVRSSKTDAWQVLFLQTAGFFEREAPLLAQKVSSLAQDVGLKEGWLHSGEELHLRVVELHVQRAPGPGLPDPRHYDMDSIVTVDVLLSTPGADFEGGHFKTLEADGTFRQHDVGCGGAVVFSSHKFHCVAPVTAGCRRVLVAEFWRGPARRCPHRCRSLQVCCPQEPTIVAHPSSLTSLPSLPFRLGSVQEVTSRGRLLKLLWQTNDEEVAPPRPPAENFVPTQDSAWDIFG